MNRIKENILCWCNEPEQGAIEQAINISKHPWLIGNVCLMPDTHEGYGMPIGGVVALDRAICPNIVACGIARFDLLEGLYAFESALHWIDKCSCFDIIDVSNAVKEKMQINRKRKRGCNKGYYQCIDE